MKTNILDLENHQRIVQLTPRLGQTNELEATIITESG